MASITWTGTDFVGGRRGRDHLREPGRRDMEPARFGHDEQPAQRRAERRRMGRGRGDGNRSVEPRWSLLVEPDARPALWRVPPDAGRREVRGRGCRRRGDDERRRRHVDSRSHGHREFAIGGRLWSGPLGRRRREEGGADEPGRDQLDPARRRDAGTADRRGVGRQPVRGGRAATATFSPAPTACPGRTWRESCRTT